MGIGTTSVGGLTTAQRTLAREGTFWLRLRRLGRQCWKCRLGRGSCGAWGWKAIDTANFSRLTQAIGDVIADTKMFTGLAGRLPITLAWHKVASWPLAETSPVQSEGQKSTASTVFTSAASFNEHSPQLIAIILVLLAEGR